MNSLRSLGHTVTAMDTTTPNSLKLSRMLIVRVIRKIIGNSIDLGCANTRLRKIIARQAFDLVWFDKAIAIKSKQLERIRNLYPNTKIVGYSPDDCMNPANQSRRFISSLPLYDLFCTTKSYNCLELESLGCKRTFFVGNAYQSDLHRPMQIENQEVNLYGGDVVFIGSWERERSDSIRALAREGIKVRIWGNGWENADAYLKNLTIEHRAVFGDEYVKAINSSKINLCFLRKMNRDLQTTRSIEIPACSAFMLAERTGEHLELFIEGKEAEFFSTDDELVTKVKYYLEHDSERAEIAAAGRRRCLASGYSNEARLREVLKYAYDSV
jgi:spore maturation protein CgeB